MAGAINIVDTELRNAIRIAGVLDSARRAARAGVANVARTVAATDNSSGDRIGMVRTIARNRAVSRGAKWIRLVVHSARVAKRSGVANSAHRAGTAAHESA